MSLAPPEKVRKLQETLHAKAKGSPGYRFYLLYDKVYRRDVLGFAFDRCRANGGAPGIDGQTFADIEAYGVETWRVQPVWLQLPRDRKSLKLCGKAPDRRIGPRPVTRVMGHYSPLRAEM